MLAASKLHLYSIYVTSVADQCSLVKDEGICPGNVPRFYFDQVGFFFFNFRNMTISISDGTSALVPS